MADGAVMQRPSQILPPSLAPRGLSRCQASAYVGVSPTKFDEMVVDKRMPKARRVDGRHVWDLRELDAAFDLLPHDGEKSGAQQSRADWSKVG